MTEDFVQIPLRGRELKQVDPDKLIIAKAREVALALAGGVLNWVEFVGCYQHLSASSNATGGSPEIVAETVVFETEVELPQYSVCDIGRRERIAVTFGRSDNRYPGAYALRQNFPEVSHLNVESFEFPRSLCLYNKPYSDIKLGWTPIAFVERIRIWLSDTASGKLHKADQPLEPLLAGSDAFIVLPTDFPEDSSAENLAKVKMRVDHWDNGRWCFSPQDARAADKNAPNNLIFSLMPILGEPQQHGRIRRKPDNLAELNEFLQSAEINLLDGLRNSLRNLLGDGQALFSGLIFVVVLPKTRTDEEPVETAETWAFACVKDKVGDNGEAFFSIAEIGKELGVLDVVDDKAGLIVPTDTTKSGEAIKLLTLAPCLPLSRENAPVWSGTKKRSADKITAVGMGALGSQVFLNLIRAGDGEWTLVDEDVLLPHNFVRHAAYGGTAGFAKAEFSALIANATISAPPIARAIVANALAPGKMAEQLSKSYCESSVILDFSASQAVARHLALDIEATARRISLFLNPTGTDLVLLAEDSARAVSLDSLEMQYYRLLINQSELKAHLKPPAGQVRFSASCREVSNQILPENVALAAAIGSQAVRQILTVAANESEAAISVWQSDENGETRKFSVAPARRVAAQINGWTICTDDALLEKIEVLRAGKLPVETGGTLVGSYDMQRKIIYIADALPAPKDSIEKPTYFIRGCYGLKLQIEAIEEMTLGNLRYVGEWHSHPAGYSAKPSDDDRALLGEIAALQHKEGNPALMLIFGGNDYTLHVA